MEWSKVGLKLGDRWFSSDAIFEVPKFFRGERESKRLLGRSGWLDRSDRGQFGGEAELLPEAQVVGVVGGVGCEPDRGE